MDQHPVPQNISSYEFRLVGDMTLKQFLQLAGGVGAAFIVYRLPIIGFIKWPLVILAAGIGLLMAFVPIQGRPFTQWFMAFLRAIYAPTEFYWAPSLLSSPTLGEDARRAGEVLPKIVTPITPPPPSLTPTPIPVSTTHNPPPAPKPEAAPLSTAEVAAFQSSLPTTPNPPSTTTQYAKVSLPAEALAKAGPTPTPTPKPTTQLGPSPLTPTIHITHPPSSTSPTTTSGIPFPSLPNILTGLVVTSQDQPQEGAIVEIVAAATNLPVRALRASKAGTFQIATPLPNGIYSLYTDKDGLSFDPISITAEGKIIKPIIIKAKNA